jgi:hypothetical protein
MTAREQVTKVRREIEHLDSIAHELEVGRLSPELIDRLIASGERIEVLGEELLSSPLLPSDPASAS